jgi:hypothetical protein
MDRDKMGQEAGFMLVAIVGEKEYGTSASLSDGPHSF